MLIIYIVPYNYFYFFFEMRIAKYVMCRIEFWKAIALRLTNKIDYILMLSPMPECRLEAACCCC